MARGAAHPVGTSTLAVRIALGVVIAATLNAASNALNQVTDLDADRINKPGRPVAAGRISPLAASFASTLAYGLVIATAWTMGAACFAAVCGGAFCTLAYSLPPLRLKRFGWAANATIALSRGLLLTLAGWTTVATASGPDPWWLGGVMALFLRSSVHQGLLGRRGRSRRRLPHPPVRYGVSGTVRRIRHAFVWPFLLLPVGAWCGALHGDRWILTCTGIVLAAVGGSIVRVLERSPGAVDASGNHVTWRRMYLAMLFMQIAVACAYLVPPSGF
ncbi:MAG: UbiA family prenyltransferase [Deltaproteobacteria bacterium]|nr:UbiA family prenyltransferase [Deltaproteobacteria bacterium]